MTLERPLFLLMGFVIDESCLRLLVVLNADHPNWSVMESHTKEQDNN